MNISVVSRGKGKSAVAAAAYRAGEKITNEYDGQIHDYTRKKGIAFELIILPDHAPGEYKSRATLWNAVEKIEKAKNAQLARQIRVALPAELDLWKNVDLVYEYVKNNFVSKGMCADIAFHDKGDGNRTLPLVPAIREKLLEVQAEQKRNRKLCGKSYNKAEGVYIYTDALGNRIKPDYLSGEFPKFLEKNGFRRMRYHDLRHSCASLLLANGVPLKQIQEWLGHSSFAITADIYAHLDYTSKIASAGAMSWIGDTSLAQEQKD